MWKDLWTDRLAVGPGLAPKFARGFNSAGAQATPLAQTIVGRRAVQVHTWSRTSRGTSVASATVLNPPKFEGRRVCLLQVQKTTPGLGND